MNKTLIESLAEKLSEDAMVKSNDKNFSSIILTVMIIGIIINVVRAVQECNKKQTRNLSEQDCDKLNCDCLKRICRSDNWFALMRKNILLKARAHKIIKKKIGVENYGLYGNIIFQSMMDISKGLTDEELHQLIKESKNV